MFILLNTLVCTKIKLMFKTEATMSKQRKFKVFFSNILNAVGAGVVLALLPNALLGEFLKLFMDAHPMLENVFQLVMIIQSFMAFIIGVLAAHQFKFNGAGSCMVGVAAMLGSGAVQFTGALF